MGDNEETLRLGFQAVGLEQVSQATTQLQDYITTSEQVVVLQDEVGSSALTSSAKLNESIQQTSSNLLKLEDSWQAAADAKAAYARIPDPTEKEALGDFSSDPAGGGGRGIRSGSILGAGAGIAGAAGGGALAEPLRIVAGIANINQQLAPALEGASGGMKLMLGAAGPLVGILAGVTVGFQLLDKQLEGAKEKLDAGISAQDIYYQSLSKTSEQIKDDIQARQDAGERLQQQISETQAAIDSGFAQAQAAFGDATARVLEAAGKLPTAELEAHLKDLQKQMDTNTDAATRETQGLEAGTYAANDLAAQEKILTDQRLKEIDVMQQMGSEVVSIETEIAQLRRTGSEEELNNLKQTKEDELKINQAVLDQFKDKQKQYASDSDEYKKLQSIIDGYTTKLTELRFDLTRLGDTTLETAVKIHDAAEQQQKLVEDSAASYAGYLQDVAKADDTFYDNQLKAHDDYMGKIEDINEAAAKQVADLLQKLNEQRTDLRDKLIESEADDAQKLHEQQLDDQIKYQRDVEKLTQDHQRTLKQILQDAATQQQELIQNRDFLGLFNLNRTTEQKVQAENDQYAEQRQALLDNLQQQTEDENRHFAEQEQQRIIQYQRQLAEAQTQYNRQSQLDARNRTDALNKAQQAYTEQLQLLSQKHQQELTQLRDTEVASLQLLRQTSTQKLALEQQYYTQSLQLLRNAVNQASGGGVAANVRAGASSGGGTVNLTQNITGGGDAGVIANVAAAAAQRTLEQFFGG